MKKNKIISAILSSVLFLTACGSKYQIDISEMPDELRLQHQERLQNSLSQHETAEDDQMKIEAAAEVAIQYMNLGNYAEAIDYYKEVLEHDEIYYVALNNIAYMYEEVGEKEKALEYELKLYENNKTDFEVTRDTIRLLVTNHKYNEAIEVLTAFSVYDKETGPNYTQVIGDQFEYIMNSQSE